MRNIDYINMYSNKTEYLDLLNSLLLEIDYNFETDIWYTIVISNDKYITNFKVCDRKVISKFSGNENVVLDIMKSEKVNVRIYDPTTGRETNFTFAGTI